MPIFRDLDGNFYDIPKDLLRKYRVEGELPESAKLQGAEVELPGGPRQPPAYFWDAPATPQPSQYFWDARATPRPSAYFWDPRVQQQQAPRAPAYFWDHPAPAAYIYDRTAVRPESVEAAPQAPAEARVQAEAPVADKPVKAKAKTRTSKKSSSSK
jgi:hypothetical protein